MSWVDFQSGDVETSGFLSEILIFPSILVKVLHSNLVKVDIHVKFLHRSSKKHTLLGRSLQGDPFFLTPRVGRKPVAGMVGGFDPGSDLMWLRWCELPIQVGTEG